MWIEFITHKKLRWKWKPWFLRSQIIFGRSGKVWLAPHWEWGWGPLVFHWTGYSHERVYKGTYTEHECPAELMQDRINELENAIRDHRDTVGDTLSMHVDRELWKVLGDGSQRR